MTALASPVLLDTSNTKISRSSLPNCSLSRYTHVLFSHQVVGDEEFFIIASNGGNLRPNTYFHFVLTEYRVVELWLSSHSQLSASTSWTAACLSIPMERKTGDATK